MSLDPGTPSPSMSSSHPAVAVALDVLRPMDRDVHARSHTGVIEQSDRRALGLADWPPAMG